MSPFEPKHFQPNLVVWAPGRINLIGEHTDYNLGYALPMAIDKGMRFGFSKNGSQSVCRIYSRDQENVLEVDLEHLEPSPIQWENYILGVLKGIRDQGGTCSGFDCVLESNLPQGAGMSSSAALECGMAYGVNELFDIGMDKTQLMKIAQKAEHDYVGTQCGIMDQFASLMGKKDHAMLLDCQNLAYNYVPLDQTDHSFLLLNTHVSHNLAESAYNERRAQCESVVAYFTEKDTRIASLRDISMEQLEAAREEIPELAFTRASYVLRENQRVQAMVNCLSQGAIHKAGDLLFQAHWDLSRAYEVSCPESDFLVEYAQNDPVVLGARQMGGGFGGCVLHLLPNAEIAAYTAKVTEAYKAAFQIELSAYTTKAEQGVYNLTTDHL